MSIPKNKFPGWFDAWSPTREIQFSETTVALIESHPDAQIIKYRDLPHEAQLAIAQYCGISDAAWRPDRDRDEHVVAGTLWPRPPGLGEAIDQHLAVFRSDVSGEAATRGWILAFRRFLPFYIGQYGDLEFGYIPNLSTKAAVDNSLADIERAGWTWEEFRRWFLDLPGEPKHQATDENPWPMIISSESDATFEDGWTRLVFYVDRGLETIPAVWFPSDQLAWNEREIGWEGHEP